MSTDDEFGAERSIILQALDSLRSEASLRGIYFLEDDLEILWAALLQGLPCLFIIPPAEYFPVNHLHEWVEILSRVFSRRMVRFDPSVAAHVINERHQQVADFLASRPNPLLSDELQAAAFALLFRDAQQDDLVYIPDLLSLNPTTQWFIRETLNTTAVLSPLLEPPSTSLHGPFLAVYDTGKLPAVNDIDRAFMFQFFFWKHHLAAVARLHGAIPPSYRHFIDRVAREILHADEAATNILALDDPGFDNSLRGTLAFLVEYFEICDILARMEQKLGELRYADASTAAREVLSLEQARFEIQPRLSRFMAGLSSLPDYATRSGTQLVRSIGTDTDSLWQRMSEIDPGPAVATREKVKVFLQQVCRVAADRSEELLRQLETDTLDRVRVYKSQFQDLAIRFRSFRTPPKPDDIERFLMPFPTALFDDVISLLYNIKFYEHSNFESLLHSFVADKPAVLNADSILTPLEEAGGSALIMEYIAAHTVDQVRPMPLHHALTEVENDRAKRIVLLEDCIFSGTQASDIIHEYLGVRRDQRYVRPLSAREKAAFASAEVYLLSFLATDRGIATIRDAMQPHFRSFDVLRMGRLDTAKLFDPESVIFRADCRDAARSYFGEVGYALLEGRARKRWPKASWEELRKKHAIGFGDDQQLVVFFYNPPKATVTLLWENGRYGGHEWRPLFPLKDN